MSRNTNRIDVSCTDERINSILSQDEGAPYTVPHAFCYNQNEDQFAFLDESISIPSIPVHHTMNNPIPPDGYTEMIANLSGDLKKLVPHLIAGTKWYFDPVDIHTPTFYRIIRIEDTDYLYLLLVDLTCRPLDSEITEEGTNIRTHAYNTNRLYFECDYFPIQAIDEKKGILTLKQSIPVTWKGEAGQGYMIHGIWMDADINKFFSKLILPSGKRNYPYYPVNCKLHCVSMNAFGLKSPALLHEIRKHIEPALNSILRDLQSTTFSELLPLFEQLKKTIPERLGQTWDNLSVRVILNNRDQKEYIVEF